jgi:hypothetical protein
MRVSSAFKRAGLASLNDDSKNSQNLKTNDRVKERETSAKDRAKDIGKRNFTSQSYDFDNSSSEEEEPEEYSIDPSVHLWKSIDFRAKDKVSDRDRVRANPNPNSKPYSQPNSNPITARRYKQLFGLGLGLIIVRVRVITNVPVTITLILILTPTLTLTD